MLTGEYGGVVAPGGDLAHLGGRRVQLHALRHGVVLHVAGAQLPLVVAAHGVHGTVVW